MKLLLVDDHALFRDGLRYVLDQLEQDVRITEAGTCGEAFAVLEKDAEFDLILLDVGLPGMSGLDGLKKIRAMTPTTPVVILSGSEESGLIRRALDMGVMGYIPKSLSGEIMLQAIQLVMKGGRYVPDHVLNDVKDVSLPKAFNLTTRQTEILGLIALGKSNKDIARKLGIADNTVRVHISSIFQSLKVSNRTEAARLAMQEGLVESV